MGLLLFKYVGSSFLSVSYDLKERLYSMPLSSSAFKHRKRHLLSLLKSTARGRLANLHKNSATALGLLFFYKKRCCPFLQFFHFF